MLTLRTCVALSAALVGAATLLPASAHAQANCQWYGTTALKQQQENERLKCGFKGPDWSSDLKAHMTWCASVAPDVWKKSAQKRDQELAVCSTGAKK